MLSGDISLNPGPSQYLQDNDNKFEPFHKGCLHFLHINVNSLLLKIYELGDFVDHTKPAILGITESKVDSSVSDQEVNIYGYCILRSDRNGRGVSCYVRADLFFNSRNIFDQFIPKVKPISTGIFIDHPM